VLQRFAEESKADLLAIGGFAHSRAREILLGGVTRDLTGENHLPLLLSH
jgi:nucleotide-binding universal stress UspA family protein